MARRRRVRDRISIHKRTEPGASPGTVVADPESPKPTVRLLSYGPDGVDEQTLDGPEQLAGKVGKKAVTWIDVDGLGDAHAIETIGKVLGLHPLALEDAVNQWQRPKVDEYPENLFVVVRMASHGERIETEQLALFIGVGFVATFQSERPGDCLDPVRKRIRVGQGRIRSEGPDYLAYAIIDAVIDNYFPVMDTFGERIEVLEDELVQGPVRNGVERIQRAKQDLLVLRRSLVPLRDAVNALVRDEARFIQPGTRLYLRDCYDHAAQLLDVVGNHRELVGGLMELHLSGVSNRMNEVMKFLTLVSTIFIPLTFIAGIYGMNFDPARSPWNMPELEWRYGYPAVMGVMALIAAATVLYFKRKGWLAPTR
ncbi:MAG TPA: magnesium/cobalt transporter CorA [Polyangiaceae bacterium]|nr:magnesium/cobalt transporter CorA [Polyangiaceae bacterium]